LGIGDWAQSPIPNPQSPIPNPHNRFIVFKNNIFIRVNNFVWKIVFRNKTKKMID
jgi:hypothetical protein